MNVVGTSAHSSVSSFVVTLAINSSIAVVCFLVFSFLRPRKWFGLYKYFGPKSRNQLIDEKLVDFSPFEFINRNFKTKFKLPDGFFAWIMPTLGYSDRKLLETHGPDAVMYLGFLRMAIMACIGMATGSIALLLVNTSGTNQNLPSSDKDHVEGMSVLTMSNLVTSDRRMIAHVIFTFLYSFLIYALVYLTYYLYTQRRLVYLNVPEIQNYTVLLADLPPHLRDSDRLKTWLERNFPFKVIAVHIVYKDNILQALFKKRRILGDNYEKAKMTYLQRKKKQKTKLQKLQQSHFDVARVRELEEIEEDPSLRPTTKTGWLGCFGRKVDAINYYEQQLKDVESRILDIQSSPETKLGKTKVAMVTFDSMFPSKIQSIAFNVEGGKKVKLSSANHVLPFNPFNVYWKQLHISSTEFWIRSILITVLLLFVIPLWGFLTLFAAGLANINKLSELSILSWLDDLQESLPKPIIGFIEGMLPSLIVLGLNELALAIIRALVRRQGIYDRALVETRVVQLITCFFLVNNVLILILSGATFQVLEDLTNHPQAILSLLQNSLPQQSLLFLNYLVVTGLGRMPLQLFRLGSLFGQYFLLFFVSRTPRQRKQARKPLNFNYGERVSHDMLIFTIVLLYSVMAPLIAIFGLIYFSFAYLIGKYNIMFVHFPKYEGGGTMWPTLCNYILFAVLLFQITMLAVLSLSQFIGTGPLIVLPVLTAIFWIFIHYRFADLARYGALNEEEEGNSTSVEAAEEEDSAIQARLKDWTEKVVVSRVKGILEESEQKMRFFNAKKRLIYLPTNAYMQPTLQPLRNIYFVGDEAVDEDLFLQQEEEDSPTLPSEEQDEGDGVLRRRNSKGKSVVSSWASRFRLSSSRQDYARIDSDDEQLQKEVQAAGVGFPSDGHWGSAGGSGSGAAGAAGGYQAASGSNIAINDGDDFVASASPSAGGAPQGKEGGEQEEAEIQSGSDGDGEDGDKIKLDRLPNQ